ncbi:LytTR family DNA-binding domain-containing protein [Pseudotabrizicola sp.]|uniref:LytTR family DNA-binding domain-containing protein n=2 Tax=Pseudotabrizicola sp. TaxID=2939647 RepID=UPI002728311E|nr:LytTR family DNA-binding domain-containing protein [Pseudotabrizicola sp.]MDO8884963.1 LytTR family DNA-binding domain-containing protein [Pseudotabrizicola sp.]MDP2082225.1 LytTR family DNA-binding domain-containing protein [Pseudotabrizicola sp.]
MTWREMQGQFRHPLFMGMMLMMALCIVVIGPYDHLLNFDVLRLTIFYGVCFGSFTGLLYFALNLCHRFEWRAYGLFTVGFAALGATFFGLAAAMVLGAPTPSISDMALVAGFNLVFCFLGEVLLSIFIIPRVLADLRGRAANDILAEFIASEAGSLGPSAGPSGPAIAPHPGLSPEMPAQISIFGQSFDPKRIFMIEAKEHYIAVFLTDGTELLLRGRIVDAVAAIPSQLGRRVHRSYWVSAVAVAALRPEKSGLQLTLTDGQSVPVARSRIPEIRPWVETVLATAKQKAPKKVLSALS